MQAVICYKLARDPKQLVLEYSEFPKSTKNHHFHSILGHCEKQFAQRDAVQKHISEVHEVYKRFQCFKCSAKFTTKNDCKNHIRDIHKTFYKCQFCNETFTGKSAFQIHANCVHETMLKTHKCLFCDLIFAETSDLETHLNTIHQGPGKMFQVTGAGLTICSIKSEK